MARNVKKTTAASTVGRKSTGTGTSASKSSGYNSMRSSTGTIRGTGSKTPSITYNPVRAANGGPKKVSSTGTATSGGGANLAATRNFGVTTTIKKNNNK